MLLVDDAADVRMLLLLALEGQGFVVDEAVDGRSGLEAVRRSRPDVVLLDVQLPDLDGPDVLRALRAEPATADVPVVFLTAAPPSRDAELVALGARGVLRKPFDLATIGSGLAALL